MADAKITALDENTTPIGTDILPIVDDPSGTAKTEKITVANLWGALNAQRGFLINGKIVPSVASDNLTVAIKGLDGNDPSASNPVYCRIGDTVRSITAALSVTKNAGTNWCDSGGAELATKEVDYFVYLGYNATDGVVVGFSRIPYAQEYSEFSATTTNEKYCAISTITNAAAGDDYEVVGRFAATLSAGAGYTWTVPTFSNINLVQRPIYETRALTMTTQTTGFTSVTSTTITYKLINNLVHLFYGKIEGTSNATTFTFTLPFKVKTTMVFFGFEAATDAGVSQTASAHLMSTAASATINAYKAFYQVAWTNTGVKNIHIINTFFEI